MNGVQKSERDALRPSAKVRIGPALALCAAIMLAGVAIGVGISAIFPFVPGMFGPSRGAPRSFEDMCDRYMTRLDSEVGLTSQQNKQIRPIIETHVRELMKIREQIRPELVQETRQLDAQIRPLLTPQQLPAWQKYYDERLKRWSDRTPETQPAAETAPAP
ncbi:MAG: hypothetical protein LLG01_05990 [Planctomycetaceae bacterium]|nr:hypothetical protein [Planctomycetaceae bacterium]